MPTLAGLYAKRLPGWAAALSIILGIIGGAILFPDPNFTRGNLLYSFAVAMFIPLVLTIIFNRIGEPFDYKDLGKRIHDVSA